MAGSIAGGMAFAGATAREKEKIEVAAVSLAAGILFGVDGLLAARAMDDKPEDNK